MIYDLLFRGSADTHVCMFPISVSPLKYHNKKMYLAIAASIRVHLCFYIGIVFLMENLKNCKNYVTE